MSKKSRENSSKSAAGEATGAAPAPPVKKTVAAIAGKPTRAAAGAAVKKVAKTVTPAAKPAVKKPKAAAVKTAKPAVGARPVAATPDAAPAVAIEGARAPAFTLPRDGGKTISLADYAGRKLVLFFYPRAGTPGCTREAIDFTRLGAAFAAVNTAVLGVSADPLKAQESFRDKHDLTTPLLSDETHMMLQAYGAWGEKSMYGKVFEGVLRSTVLIDASGRVAKIWRGVKVDGHADAVLEEVRRI